MKKVKGQKEIAGRLWRFVRTNTLFRPNDDLVVGFSGGPDSVALVLILEELVARGVWHGDMVLAHLNHGLRGKESDADEQFCREFAARHDLDLVAERLAEGEIHNSAGSLEKSARNHRYDFLRKVAASRNISTVAVGHHLDDVAETVLMRLIRGCGLSGLGAIPSIRPIARNSTIDLIRPLLEERRSDLMDILRERGEQYRHDSSNRDTAYFRNLVRHEILPFLNTSSGIGLERLLGEMNETALELNHLLDGQAERQWRDLHVEQDSRGVAIDSQGFGRLSMPLRRLIAGKALKAVGGDGAEPLPLTRNHWEEVCKLTERTVGTELSLPGGFAARREHGFLYFLREEDRTPADRGECKNLDVPGVVTWKDSGMRITARFISAGGGDAASLVSDSTAHHVYLSGDALNLPLWVRMRKDGDVFFPLGAPGQKKLKDYFIDKKVPHHRRDRVPLVVNGDERIVWVVGHEISEEFKLQGNETRVLELISEHLIS
jgi:tRNA(Ile)-lysidine synthase